MATYIKPEAIKDGTLTVGKLGIDAMTESEKEQFLCKLGLGKIGVVSQKQNWASDNSGYTISDVVRGFIPQEFITQAKAAGAVYNDATGYFEANSLTDLTYEDTQKIMIESGGRPFPVKSSGLFKASAGNGRTVLFPTINEVATGIVRQNDFSVIADNNKTIEDFTLNTASEMTEYLGYAFFYSLHLRVISLNVKRTTDINATFDGCKSLKKAYLRGLKLSVSFPNSPLLTTESILYMINNAQSATITITLHASAYARAMADESILAALEAHTNISLAQA